VLGPVPLPPQFGKGPGHLNGGIKATLVQPRLNEVQAPIVGDPGSAAVRRQCSALPRCGVQREPVALGHHGHLASLWKSIMVVVDRGYELAATAGAQGVKT
jgi:hypothetical protein